jgi:hypothetical protein
VAEIVHRPGDILQQVTQGVEWVEVDEEIFTTRLNDEGPCWKEEQQGCKVYCTDLLMVGVIHGERYFVRR